MSRFGNSTSQAQGMVFKHSIAAIINFVILLISAPILHTAAAQSERPSGASKTDTIYVYPPTGEKESDRASILAALDLVQPEGTIQFATGTYLVGKGISVKVPGVTLLGHPEGTIIRGCDPEEMEDRDFASINCNGIELAASNQTVRGFTFEYAYWALHLGCCRNERIQYALPNGMTSEGTAIYNTGGGHLVEDNTFRSSMSGIRMNGDWTEPAIIRNNRFINNWHGVSINGNTVYLLNNEFSVPEPEQVPIYGFPRDAVKIGPPLPIQNIDERYLRAGVGNIVEDNMIRGYYQGVSIQVYEPGTSCRDNIIRNNIIEVRRGKVLSPIGSDSSFVGNPLALHNFPEALRYNGPGQESHIEANIIDGNRIIGGEGLGIEMLHASRNLISNNTITAINKRVPFLGNIFDPRGSALEWSEANGSGIWISPGSSGNEIINNTFREIASAAVFIEGGSNWVEINNKNEVVRDLGAGNSVDHEPDKNHLLPNKAHSISEKKLKEVDSYIKYIMKDQKIPGLALAITYDGKVLKRGNYGLASLEYKVPVSDSSVFWLASVSKHITCSAIMLLSQERVINIEDKIREYLPDAPDNWKEVTIRNLMTHTSGLPESGNGSERGERSAMGTYSAGQMYENAKRDTLAFKPGEDFLYSDAGIFLLGYIIHRASGMSFKEFLQKRIFDPSGMKTAYLMDHFVIHPNQVTGYSKRDGKIIPDRNYWRLVDTEINAAGGVYATVNDLINWEKTLSGEQLLTAESKKLMWSSYILNNGNETLYGFGWNAQTIRDKRIIYHPGVAGTEYLRFVDDKVSIIVLTNQADYQRSIAYKIAEILGISPEKGVNDIISGQISKTIPSQKEIEQISGEYNFIPNHNYYLNNPIEISIVPESNQLWILFPTNKEYLNKYRLIPLDNGRWMQLSWDPVATEFTYEISPDKDGFPKISVFEFYGSGKVEYIGDLHKVISKNK